MPGILDLATERANDAIATACVLDTTIAYGEEIQKLPDADKKEALTNLLPGLEAASTVRDYQAVNTKIRKWIDTKTP